MISYGICDSRSSQGWMYQLQDRRYWCANFDSRSDNTKPDGKMYHDGKSWRSTGGARVTHDRAVTDDFGMLVPV